MYHSRFQALMTTGYALANKLYFKEFDPEEFNQWIEGCERLLANCEPEPHFPLNPDPRHIEEIVFLLLKVSSEISRGQVDYRGIL